MADIKYNHSLKEFNTFGINIKAAALASVSSLAGLIDDIPIFISDYPRYLVLGGGSNVLFINDFPGIVIQMATKGIEETEAGGGKVILRVQAGETWNDVVDHAVGNSYWGIENLALIPGSAGAAPVQNIGAYGVELKDVFFELTALDLLSGKVLHFGPSECCFGYRDSYFKREGKKRYIILTVSLLLDKSPNPKLDYGSLKEYLQSKGISKPTLREIRDAVSEIRQAKLPDPRVIGNAGSFFKNPTIRREEIEGLSDKFPGIPFYPAGEGFVKVASGWMIEQCGWKGKRFGDAGVHDRQALVLVNHGHASGNDILGLAKEIEESVLLKFGIPLEREVNVVVG